MKPQEDWSAVWAALSASGIIGLVVGVMRGVIQQKHGSFAVFFRGILASLFVAVIVNLGIADTDLTETTRAAIVGIAAFIADDILLGLLSLAALLGKDPLGFLGRLVAAYRGQAANGSEGKERK